ncbi:6302_t:CDS:2, partial [Entrophospora sp. SA101]
SFKLILPVQKEFSSYLSFTKVTKLYGIQVPTIQDLKQFEPGTYSWNPEDICDKMVVTLKPQNFGGTGSANEPTIAEFVSAVMHNIIGSLNGSNLQFNYNDSLSGEYFDYVYGIVTTGIQWVFLIFSSKFKAAASTRNILQLNISSENVNEEQLAMDLKKIFSVILWMLDDRIHSIGRLNNKQFNSGRIGQYLFCINLRTPKNNETVEDEKLHLGNLEILPNNSIFSLETGGDNIKFARCCLMAFGAGGVNRTIVHQLLIGGIGS